jgi:glycine/D-amino acid oxidase-like deaminating enzyme
LAVKKFIKEYQVDCDWNEAGKYFASSEIKDKKILDNFSNTLNKLNFDNNFFFENDLKDKLGTNFYKVALYTKGGILINPAKLARAMIDTLPDNVELIENFQLLKWSSINGSIICYFKKNKIISKNIIFCTNGFLSSLGLKKNYNFPISLTASMTRKLDDNEFRNLGEPNEWGVLPVKAMGATIRMTKDRRILIRNTAELNNPFLMEKKKLEERKKIHLNGIKKRFPFLPNDIIEHTWSGIVCRSRNSSQLFEKIDKNIFIAGCYNGSGIGVGTLFGEQIALKATNNITDEINLIENRLKPSLLPPQPFLNLGIRTRLFFERFMAQKEI